ncbi:MAG: hypothetical protein WAL63_21880 [Solirubrobacteraceae bacterium]
MSSSRGSQQIKIEINNRSREVRSSFPSGLTGQQRTVSFTDLGGKLSRHPVAFNRYCRNVAGPEARRWLLLSLLLDPDQKSAPPRRLLTLIGAVSGGGVW